MPPPLALAMEPGHEVAEPTGRTQSPGSPLRRGGVFAPVRPVLERVIKTPRASAVLVAERERRSYRVIFNVLAEIKVVTVREIKVAEEKKEGMHVVDIHLAFL